MSKFTAIVGFSALLVVVSSRSFSPLDAKSRIEASTQLRPPVILVPGLEGSQLDAKLDKPSTVNWLCSRKTKDWFPIWVDVKEFFPEVIDCFMDNLSMRYNRTTRRTTNAPGVQIAPTAFGKTDGIEYLSQGVHLDVISYYAHVVDALVSVGYQRNVNVRGAPYDWRKSPNDNLDYFVNLKALVEQSFAENGNAPNVLICHSMGCLYSSYFLNQQTKEWKKTHIRSLIALSAPWSGAVPAVRAIIAGANMKMSNLLYANQKLRPMARSFSSSYFLLPTKAAFTPKMPFISYDGRDYTVDDYELLFQQTDGMEDGREMWFDSKDLMTLEHPGVDVSCIHGEAVETIERLNYKTKADFPDNPELVMGVGDGTVNKASLEACQRWNQNNEFNFEYKTFNGLSHIDTIRSADVANLLLSSIANYMN